MSENEDDWFEQGIEDDEDADEHPDDDWFDSAAESNDEDPPATDHESDGEGPESESILSDEETNTAGDDTEDLEFQDLSGGTNDPPPSGGSASRSSGGDDQELFERDFASELGDVETPVPQEGGGDEFEAGTGSDENFGMGGGDDFGIGGGEDFGMGGGGFGMAGDDFEDEEFDSDISRIDLGIEGLDEMIQGGVPQRTLMVAIGSAGTGKTTFGIQFLDEELRREDGGNAVFITLEESSDRIISSATEKGYPFDEYVENDRLAIVDMDPIEMANSLATIRSELPRLISEFNAERLVLDSVSLLEMMYDSRATRRNEIYDFTKSLKEAGVTTMMTSEADSTDPYTSRYGIVEYLTDAVFVLQYVRPSDFRKTRLAVEIQKIRDANHSRETKPYEITNSGISVYRQANIF